jgi:Spx/MgsR family transcriptional regulator
MTARIHGIKACDTMKKAFVWLDAHGVAYEFHDYKKAGANRDDLARWCARAGWQTVLNRSGTTFRKLPDHAKADLDADKAIALMLAQPSMIRRPVLETGDTLEIGFNSDRYATIFA